MREIRVFWVIVLVIITVGPQLPTTSHADQSQAQWRYLLDEDFESGERSPQIGFYEPYEVGGEAGNSFMRVTSEAWQMFTVQLGLRGIDYHFSAQVRLEASLVSSALALSLQSDDGDYCNRYQTYFGGYGVDLMTYYPLAGTTDCYPMTNTSEQTILSFPEDTWMEWRMDAVGDKVTARLDGEIIGTLQRDGSQFFVFVMQAIGTVDIDELQIEMSTAPHGYTPPPVAEWESRFSHVAGMRLRMPVGFETVGTYFGYYSNGQAEIIWGPNQWQDQPRTPDIACTLFQPYDFPGGSVGKIGDNYCIMHPMAGLEWAFPDLAIIIPPTERIGQPVANSIIPEFMWLRADRSIIEGIVESIEFPESPTATEYVQEALRYIQTHYIYLDQLDWADVSAHALSMVNTNSPLDDAHAALSYVMEQTRAIGDNHFGFIAPAEAARLREGTRAGRGYRRKVTDEGDIVTLVYPGSPAERWGLQVGDLIESINGLSPTAFDEAVKAGDATLDDILTYRIRRPGEPEVLIWEADRAEFSSYLPMQGHRMASNLGYIEIFGTGTESPIADQTRYVTEAHQFIEGIDEPPVCGWIVDVRRNSGGNVVVMALAYAPLLGDGVIFGSRRADDPRTAWLSYTGGIADSSPFPMGGIRILFTPEPYTVQHLNMPVAVLVSSQTASMGELTVMAFKTRPDAVTRVFGEDTRGYLRDTFTSLSLADGALLYVVDKMDIDRNGNPFPSSILPDVPMEVDYSVYGTDDDPMIQAAQAWLMEQPECQ